jgi:hypothetical protein
MLVAVIAASGAHATSSVAGSPLIAAKKIQAGYVSVFRHDMDLYVWYYTNECWTLDEVHLYLGACPPTKSAPGRFPYKAEGLGGTHDWMFVVPLEELGLDCWDTVYIAAHAVVTSCACTGQETAWACGKEIRPGKNWAMYFCGVIPCPFPP